MSAISAIPSGSAGDIDTRPRYQCGSPNHDVATSVTTAVAHTQSTAGEIGHDAHPTQRQAHPLALACSSVCMGTASSIGSIVTLVTSLADHDRRCDPGRAKSR